MVELLVEGGLGMYGWRGVTEWARRKDYRKGLTTHIVELPVTSALEVMCQALVMMSKGWITSMSDECMHE